MISDLIVVTTLLLAILLPFPISEATLGGEKSKSPLSNPNDEYVDGMLDDDKLMESDSYFSTLSQDVSGDYFLTTNSTDAGEMELVMDMIFNTEYATEYPEYGKNAVATEGGQKDRTKKSSAQKENKGLKVPNNEDLLEGITELLEKDSNATFRVVNGVLIIEDSRGVHEPSIDICGSTITDFAAVDDVFQNLSSSDENEIRELFRRYSKHGITKEELRKGLMKHVGKIKCSTSLITTTAPVSEREVALQALREWVEDGVVDEKLYHDVESGRITPDQASRQLMTNEKFVMMQFPEKLSELVEEERIPAHISKVMFTGQYNLDELKLIIYLDDSISKALLPERLRRILENRDPPEELKYMLYEGHNHSTIVNMAMTNETLIEDMMSSSMYYFYTLFKVPRNRAINLAMSGTTILALTCVMMSLGCTMTVTEIMKHVKRPKGVLIALAAQYGLMPAAAFGLTQAFNLDVYPAIAVLICGCCPGGNLSNLLAFAINGDMNLSILMTTCSSVFGLAMMPFLLFCYSRFIIPIDGAEIVPFGKIILNIVLTIFPVSIGIAIKHYRPTWTKHVMRFGAVMLLLCSITFSTLAGILLGDQFFSYFPKEVVICAAILPISGYIFGFIFARLVRENQQCSRTISVETGCQNVQLCGTVLKLAFDPVLIGAMMLLPIIYMAFQAGEALFLITLYRLYERFFKKKNSDDEDSEIKFDDEEKKVDSSESGNEDEIKAINEDEKKPLKEEKNGDSLTNNNKTVSELDENWPLVHKTDENFLNGLENAKENYV